MAKWRRFAWLSLLFLLAGCAPGAVRTPTGTPVPVSPSPSPTVIARPAPSPSLLATPATPIAVSPTLARPTATVAATPTATATPIVARNGNVQVLTGHTGPVDLVAWSPDGTRFATSSGQGNSPDYSVHLWRVDGTLQATWTQPDIVRALAWSPDGQMLASGSAEATLRLSDPDGNLISTLDAGPDPLLSLAWSPDGQILAIGGFVSFRSRPPGSNAIPGVIRLMRPNGEVVTTIRTQMTGGKFMHIIWSPDGTLLAGGAIDFYIWRLDSTVAAPLRSGGTPAPAMDWSPRGDRIAIGDENGILLLFDGSGKALPALGAIGSGSVWDAAFSPDGRTLAIVKEAGVFLIATENPQSAPRQLRGGPVRSDIRFSANLAWSPDGSRFATALRDGQLWVWFADGTPLTILDGCPGEILRVAWSPDGRMLVAGSQAGAVCVWRF